MKRNYPASVFTRLTIALASLVAAIIIHSCKKDSDGVTTSKLDPALALAKSWYESAYPAPSATAGKLVTQSSGEPHDLSRLIKPDWYNAVRYVKDNRNVIETPVDPSSNFASTFKVGGRLLNKTYSLAITC